MANKNFKIIAEAIVNGSIGKVDFPTEHLDTVKLTVSEVSSIVKEEFEKAKDANKTKAKEAHFQDAELAKEINWVTALKLKEFFKK